VALIFPRRSVPGRICAEYPRTTVRWRTDSRDRGAQALAKAVAADQNERVVLFRDVNGTMDDRPFADITSQMHSAQDSAGDGFGGRRSRLRGSPGISLAHVRTQRW
jgi:hypothetical protein